MITVTDARDHIVSGAAFVVMRCPYSKREDIYKLKYPWRDGINIPIRTGRYLEKSGVKPEEWRWDP